MADETVSQLVVVFQPPHNHRLHEIDELIDHIAVRMLTDTSDYSTGPGNTLMDTNHARLHQSLLHRVIPPLTLHPQMSNDDGTASAVLAV